MNSLLQSISSVGPTTPAQKPDLVSLSGATAAAGASTGNVQGPRFTEVLSGMAGQVMGNLNQAENISVAAVKGQANTREVVDSLMTAEQSLKTAIAIRDKIVTAYLDVTRMQI